MNVKFTAGDAVAYGTYENENEYSVDHAPTQADFDAIVLALEEKRATIEKI